MQLLLTLKERWPRNRFIYYYEGYVSGKDDDPSWFNPYKEGTIRYQEWMNGWSEGQTVKEVPKV